MIANGQVQPCCQQETNLKAIETRPVEGGVFVVKQCQVCQRKHYELQVEPIQLTAEGGRL